MVETHKIIAIYGNSGSYKTVTAVNLAKAIAENNKDASVAIVGLDHTKPLIPLLFPESKSDVSLGKLLSSEGLDQDGILKQCEVYENICIFGYNSYENCQSHAFPTDARIDDFIMQMRHLFNYTIIDCTSDVTYKMTAKSLICSDNVIYLISCDINGLLFHQSQESILIGEQYGYNNYLRYLTISERFLHDEEAVKNSVSGVSRLIPYSDSIPELWNEGKAFANVSDNKYNDIIEDIADTLTEVEYDE